MDLDEIIQNIQRAKPAVTDEDMRRLPCKKAFIYGRVSSRGQVRESEESIREIAQLVALAKKDGYQSGLDPARVEKWLEDIQSGTEAERVIEDGEIVVDCRDLGLSGSLGEDKRPGLADLWQRVESGEVGAVYLTEGMSRLSRDRDRVLGYQVLKLLKGKQCRVRTPREVYNPALARDWDYLARDVEKSADEMIVAGIRLGERRASKARDGEHVGSPVSPGYFLPIEGRRRDGSYVFGKWQLYSPHQQVVIEALEEVVRQGSVYKAVDALHAQRVVFPFFPPDLDYMETRSALRFYLKDSTGYLITYNDLKSLATNLKLAGVWQWKGVLKPGNHDPAVPADLFSQAYQIACSEKPRGRAAYAEPMEWSGLLYDCNHEEPWPLSALNTARRWACRYHQRLGPGEPCLQIADHMLTPPLSRKFLECLDLTPHAEAVLEQLKSEVSQQGLDESQRRRQEAAHEKRIANLKGFLGSTDDPEREAVYWQLIDEEKAKLDLLKRTPPKPQATPVDLDRVKRFLENLEQEWERYPSRLRNRLIELLVDRVELRHDASWITASIVWRAGFKQMVRIKRSQVRYSREKIWRKEEDDLLRMLWPTASVETIMAAFSGRSWAAMNQKASALKISRARVRADIPKGRRWTREEKDKLKELYIRATSIGDIAAELQRSPLTVTTMASAMGLSRPKELRHRRLEPEYETLNIKLLHESSPPQQ